MFCEDRAKEIKLLFLFKRDLNLKGRLKQKGEQEKDGDDIYINIRHIETLPGHKNIPNQTHVPHRLLPFPAFLSWPLSHSVFR